MTSSHANNLVDRYGGTWGDTAETEFQTRVPEAIRFGLDKPPLNWGVHKLPLFMRYAPDFLLPNALVEVQGFGKNGLRIKTEKLRALDQWEHHLPVYLWLWSSARNDYLWMPLDAVWAMIDGEEVFHEAYSDTARGKHVVRIRPSDLPWGVHGRPT